MLALSLVLDVDVKDVSDVLRIGKSILTAYRHRGPYDLPYLILVNMSFGTLDGLRIVRDPLND